MNRYHCALLFAGFATTGWSQVQTVTVEVPANQAWTRTGVFLNPGSSVLLEARGTVEAVPPSDTRPLFHRVPPDGRSERQSNKPQPLMPALVMLAQIGDGPVLQAGSRAEFQAGDQSGSGELQLGINDDYVADNSGSWSVRVTIRGGSSNVSQQQNAQQQTGNARSQGQYGTRRRDSYQGGNRDSRQANAAIDNKVRQLGSGYLGQPTSDILTTADGIGRYREYQNGSVYWSPDTGAHEVHGAILEKWRSSGAEGGDLGYPTSDEMQDRDGRSRITRFQRGSIVWNEQNGARVEGTSR